MIQEQLTLTWIKSPSGKKNKSKEPLWLFSNKSLSKRTKETFFKSPQSIIRVLRTPLLHSNCWYKCCMACMRIENHFPHLNSGLFKSTYYYYLFNFFLNTHYVSYRSPCKFPVFLLCFLPFLLFSVNFHQVGAFSCNHSHV